jgi:hypothetical protein
MQVARGPRRWRSLGALVALSALSSSARAAEDEPLTRFQLDVSMAVGFGVGDGMYTLGQIDAGYRLLSVLDPVGPQSTGSNGRSIDSAVRGASVRTPRQAERFLARKAISGRIARPARRAA